MKKYFLIAVAACLCLAMTAPAIAEVKMSGSITTDIYWLNREGARIAAVPQGTTPTWTDQTTFHIDSYRPQNYLQATYTNKDNTVGGRFRIRLGHNETGLAWSNTVSEVEFQTTHMWWKFYPGAKVSIGSVKQVIGGAGALQPLVGTNRSESGMVIVGIGINNLHTSARQGVLLEWVFNKTVGLEVGLYDPANWNAGAAIPGTNPGGVAPVEIKVPRIDIAVPIKWAGFKFNPVGSWITREYDMVAANSVTSYDVWAAGIDVSYSKGPIYVAAEYKVGDNLTDANYAGGILGALAYVDANGVTQISDAENTLWFISGRYAITKKFRIKATYGQGTAERPGNPNITGDDQNIERAGYGIGADWFLAPNLICTPEIYQVDRGGTNTIAGVITDNGKITAYGLQFQLLF